MSGTPEIERLVHALDDCKTRSTARRELERLGAAAADKLLELAGNEEAGDNARWAALSLLGKCRHRPAIPTLVKVMQRSSALRADALRALQAVTGVDHGDDAEAWLAEAAPAAPAAQAVSAVPAAPPVPAAVPAPTAGERPEIALVREAVGDLAQEIAWEDPATVRVRIAPGAGRARDFRVSFGLVDRTVRPMVCIHVEAGPATPGTQAVMFRHNVSLHYGNYELEKDPRLGEHAVLRYRTSPDSLTYLFLRDILLGMATDLAQIDDELGKADRMYPWRATDPSGS